MKKITFRRQVVLVVWMLLCGLSAQAADEDLITEQITINALEAGTLPQRISSSKKNLITNLKIIGEINGTDLKFIREMAGMDVKDHSTDGKLSILDLYDAKIVSGGDCYYIDDYTNNYYTQDNRIGEHAFWCCDRLTSVTLPSSVKWIDHGAFIGCGRLTSVTFPSGLVGIGSAAFRDCDDLTNVTLPSSLVEIGSRAFWDCDALTNVTLPYGLVEIGSDAFCDCNNLTSVTLPSSLVEIGSEAFRGCI